MYGEEAVIFKFHQSLHFGNFWDSFKSLPTCWVCERKHKNPKRWLNSTVNTSIDFDRSAFRDVTATHITKAKRDIFDWVGLVPPLRKAPPDVLQHFRAVFGPACCFTVARVARASDFEHICAGDVVEGYNGTAAFLGKVATHVRVDETEDCFSILELWTCTESKETYTVWDASAPTRAFVRTTDIMCASIWAKSGSCIKVLKSSRSRREHADGASG